MDGTKIEWTECIHCGHYLAHHGRGSRRRCRGYNPDAEDFMCVCPGWEPKPQLLTTSYPTEDHKSWINE